MLSKDCSVVEDDVRSLDDLVVVMVESNAFVSRSPSVLWCEKQRTLVLASILGCSCSLLEVFVVSANLQ